MPCERCGNPKAHWTGFERLCDTCEEENWGEVDVHIPNEYPEYDQKECRCEDYPCCGH